MHLVLKQRERRLLQYSDEHLSRLFTLFEVNCAGKSALISFLSGQQALRRKRPEELEPIYVAIHCAFRNGYKTCELARLLRRDVQHRDYCMT